MGAEETRLPAFLCTLLFSESGTQQHDINSNFINSSRQEKKKHILTVASDGVTRQQTRLCD